MPLSTEGVKAVRRSVAAAVAAATETGIGVRVRKARHVISPEETDCDKHTYIVSLLHAYSHT